MKKLLLFSILLTAMACSHKPDIEVIVTANTNLCPNCYNEYRFLDSISEDCKLHLLFQSTNPNEAQKFADKFLKISRNYDIICDDTLFKSLSHNIFPWLYLYKDGELVFDAELNQSEKWIPILKKLQNASSFGLVTAKLPDDMVLSGQNRCISLNDNYLIMDFAYHELHLFDKDFKHVASQDFSKTDLEKLYFNIFGDRKTLREVRRYSDQIRPYIPDFGKIKIDNGCVFHDTLFLLINVNYTETYLKEQHQDSTVRILNETAIVGLDKNLEIKDVYPLRFRDSLHFKDFEVCAWQNCVFFIKDWDNIFLGVSQKEKSEKRILCRMERRDGEIRFKSLVDNAFIPEFNEKHDLGTSLCLIKIDSQNAYFNAAPVITNYENGKQVELPFSNDNAHFDLRHGIAESDYILADAVQTTDGGFLLSYYWKNDKKLSLIDSSGSIVWTLHLPKDYDKVYLVDENRMIFVD